jgi:hypothetical protein
MYEESHGKNPVRCEANHKTVAQLATRGLFLFCSFFKISNAIEEKPFEEHNAFRVFRLLHTLHGAAQRSEQAIWRERLRYSMTDH